MSELKGTKTSKLKLKGNIHAVKEGIDGGYYMPTLDQNTLSFQPSRDDMPAAASANLEEIMTSSDKFIEVQETAAEAKAIAEGAKKGFVFDTEAELDTWLLDEDNIGLLHLGDNLYIRDTNVPDYWWDGTSKQPLEAKTDLTDYVKNTDYASLNKAGIVKVYPGTYGLKMNEDNLVIAPATKSVIDKKEHKYMPIVPSILDYAVKKAITESGETLTPEEQNAAQNWLGVPNTAWVQGELEPYVKNTDIANAETAGVVKVEPDDWAGLGVSLVKEGKLKDFLKITPAGRGDVANKNDKYIRPLTPGNIDYIILKGLTDNKENWTEDEKKAARDLLGAVSNTQYPTYHEDTNSVDAGMIKTRPDDGWALGVEVVEDGWQKGYLRTKMANNGEIVGKKNEHRPIVPANLDYAVLKSLSDSKVTWNDEEKAKTRTLLDVPALIDIIPKGAITTESYYEESYIELEASTLYVFVHNSGSNNIELKLQNADGTYFNPIDASQETIPSFQAGGILVPKAISDPVQKKADSEGNLTVNDYDDRTALLVGVTGKTLGMPQIATKQFFYNEYDIDDPYNPRINHGTIYAHNKTGSLTIWKIKL